MCDAEAVERVVVSTGKPRRDERGKMAWHVGSPSSLSKHAPSSQRPSLNNTIGRRIAGLTLEIRGGLFGTHRAAALSDCCPKTP